MSVKKILKCFAHAVAQATDEVVGDMSEANFLCLRKLYNKISIWRLYYEYIKINNQVDKMIEIDYHIISNTNYQNR